MISGIFAAVFRNSIGILFKGMPSFIDSKIHAEFSSVTQKKYYANLLGTSLIIA